RMLRNDQGVKDARVILIGHSVGAYILLEVIRRLRENVEREEEGVQVIGGICLFPTVTHIAKSPSGRKSSVCFHLIPRPAPVTNSCSGFSISVPSHKWPR